MRITGLILAAVTVVALLIAGCPAEDAGGGAASADGAVAGGAGPVSGIIPDQLIVNVTPGAEPAAVDALVAEAGGTVLERVDALAAVLIEVDPRQRNAAETTLNDSPLVEGTADNQQYSADPGEAPATGGAGWHLAAVDATGAWATTTGAPTVLVAVLDTGVDASHPVVAGKLVSGANVADGVSGTADTLGHGTAVASVIAGGAATGATSVGIAPGVRILPIRVTDGRDTATSWSLAAGMALAVERGARVINISLAPDGAGSDAFLLRQAEAARLRGALVVMAMGNSGQRTAAAATESITLIGAVDEQLARASFSAYGPALALAAPGVDIQAAALGGGLALYDGTSLATPIVSGVAALALSANASLRPATLRAILESTAGELGAAGWDESFGSGLVNAADAVALARATREFADSTAPQIDFVSPRDGETVLGLIDVSLGVTDGSDVSDVALYLDDRPLASDSLSPYGFVVDVDAFISGKHVLTATATDVFGNAGSATIVLDFLTGEDLQAPTLVIAAPAAGATLSGSVTLRVDASDDRRLESCTFIVAGETIATVALDGAEAPAVFEWDVARSGLASGDATLTARVADAAGNVASESIRVRIAR
jgi:subtilisin family serine protease